MRDCNTEAAGMMLKKEGAREMEMQTGEKDERTSKR